MSTLKVENLQHKDSVSPNLVLNSDGSITAQSYIGDGSQLTGISSYTDSDLVSYLGANDIGIGKTNPSYPLDVDVGAPNSADKTIARFSSQAGIRDIGFVWDDSASTMGIATLTNHSMVFHTNGNSNPRMIIDNNGYVTMPNLPAFDAYYTANGTWSIGASNTLVFNATTFNQGGHYDTSNGRFTAPVSGVYHFTFYSIVNGSYTNGDLDLYVNGVRGNGTDRHFSPTGNWNTIGGSNTRYLNAGDYVMVFSRSGADFHGGYWSNFSGHLVG